MATTFERLLSFSRVLSVGNISHDSMTFIASKLANAQILSNDLTRLVSAHISQDTWRYEENSEVICFDPIYTMRIASTCEAICSTIYGAGEICARCIGPKLHPQRPSDFRSLKKHIEDGDCGQNGFIPDQFDFSGHSLILAIRTEVTHYSSVFVAGPTGGPVTLCFRRFSENMKVVDSAQIQIDKLQDAVKSSVQNIEKMLCIFFDSSVFPKLKLDQMIKGNVERDKNGLPLVVDGRFTPLPDISVREHLIKSGLAHLL